MKTLIQEKIDYIYEHKQELLNILHSNNNTFDHNRVFFDDDDESYIGIQQGYENITCKIILVGGGVWQYTFINTKPHSKKHITLNEFLSDLVKKIKKHGNNKK